MIRNRYRPLRVALLLATFAAASAVQGQRYTDSSGKLRMALARSCAPNAKLDPPLADEHVVMAGVRLTDPLEQELLNGSKIEQVTVDDLRKATPAVFAQLDRLNRLTDKIYIHIDMDVLDPREVMGHQNKVPNGPSIPGATVPSSFSKPKN
ncbi:MAG: arginase family protein [Gemmatimonadaceae bacterium]